MKSRLTDFNYQQAAIQLDCDIPAIRAVIDVEAPNGGFNPDDTPVTLFESHHFSRFTNRIYDNAFPYLSSKKWNRNNYGKTWQQEQLRLQQAMLLNREAALKSASWGRPQIMGFNYLISGCRNIQEFVNAMYRSEESQLNLFCNFLKSNKLDIPLRRHDWDQFAFGYNGPSYSTNKYDARLEAAFNRHRGI